MRVPDPVSGRPGTDVEVLLVAIRVLNCVRATRIAHLAELIDRFVDRVEVALAHLDPVSDVVTGLVRVLRRAETCSAVIR